MSIDEQHIALPKLYGAPAYARPPAPVAVTPRPFDPDDLPIVAHQSDDELEANAAPRRPGLRRRRHAEFRWRRMRRLDRARQPPAALAQPARDRRPAHRLRLTDLGPPVAPGCGSVPAAE